MNQTLARFLVSALFLPAAVLAADFEGTVSVKMSGREAAAGKNGGAQQEMNFNLKGGMMRVDAGAQGQTIGVIMDSTKQQMIILMGQQHMYMVRAMPTPTAAGGSGADKTGGPALEKTGVTEKILGYDCDKYVMKDKARTTELWLTGDLGQFMGLGNGGPMGRRGGGPAPQGWEDLLQGKNFFPMRVVSTEGGKEVGRFEVTAVEKKSLPDALFTVPDGWQDMSAMMRGMPMPGGRPGGN